MSAVTTNALAIPELLEQILAQLPPLDIIQYQRVSYTWKTVIAESSLLQYKTWQRNDYIDPVRSDDFILPPIHYFFEHYTLSPEERLINEKTLYIDNISTHLHPIIVARIMRDIPNYLGCSFDFEWETRVRDGVGAQCNEGTFRFRPSLLRDLVRWYDQNKDTKDKWGKMSLYRPSACKAIGIVPGSNYTSVPFTLVARLKGEADNDGDDDDDPEADALKNHIEAGNNCPILTLSDLFSRLDSLWEKWMNSEREIHRRGHAIGVCDYNSGLPDQCLDSGDNERDEEKLERRGVKMTREQHLEISVRAASNRESQEAVRLALFPTQSEMG